MSPSGPPKRAGVLRLHSSQAEGGAALSPGGNTGREAGLRGATTTLRPALKLAGAPEEGPAPERAEAVARENRLASGMTPDDARWVFARRVAENLEGGKAALLTPERRRMLLATARRVGLRDFDANLVIALVQDARRSGKGALNPDAEHALLLIRPADEKKPWPEWVRFAIAAAIMGVVMAVALGRWVAG